MLLCKESREKDFLQDLEGYSPDLDLTKMRCRNRENDKYIDGIRDLTAPREAGPANIWARDVGLITLHIVLFRQTEVQKLLKKVLEHA